MKEAIRSAILAMGADACGFGGLERFAAAPEGFRPVDLFEGCRSVVAVGVALPKGTLRVAPRLLYGHFNADVVHEVDRIVLAAAKLIERKCGGLCVPVPSDAPYEYWNEECMTGKGLLSMRHAAEACGLGQIGRSGLLLSPVFGNRLILGALLTDVAFQSDPYSLPVCIPGCRRCQDACPASAIGDNGVKQRRCRENAFGQTARGFATVDCNACRSACPKRDGLE